MNAVTLEVANRKEQQLLSLLKSMNHVLVAYSGGVDSTYLLAVAQEALGLNCTAVLARGPMVSAREILEAQALAQQLSITIDVVDVDIMSLKEFRDNPTDRCYFCKKKLFETFLELNRPLLDSTVIEGTNASDSLEYRPGRKALQELGIRSPLLEVGLTKVEIRALSKKRNLPTWNKPSMACLASRVPYGDPITSELLHRIAQAESILQQQGFAECRVRVHGAIARIEVPIKDFENFVQARTEIVDALLLLGFRFVTLDLEGLRSGSLNPSQREEHQ